MIEYVLIAVLVILGIVIMGPYALRSVGAHFKLWDDSVQDSFTENLTQAPINDIPNIPINCNCTTTAGSCGSSTSRCAANQREYDHLCNPQGCDGAPASSCQSDTTCCTAWGSTGCGTIPLGQPATPTNCNYGYEIQSHQCGANNTVQCVPNGTCPLPACQGILSPGALYCATHSTTAPINLTQNYGISYVANQGTCTGALCQLYCDTANSYFLNPTGTACSRTFEVAPWASCPSGCTCNATTHDCSFTMCASSTAIVTAVSVTDISSPTTPPGCSQPAGNPGETCQISVTYY